MGSKFTIVKSKFIDQFHKEIQKKNTVLELTLKETVELKIWGLIICSGSDQVGTILRSVVSNVQRDS